MCGMTVDTASPAATRDFEGVTYYFCSLRCRDRFDRSHEGTSSPMHEDAAGDAVDPVCSMRVSSASALSALGPDGLTYYFCSEGCRTTFLEGPRPPASQPIELGRTGHE